MANSGHLSASDIVRNGFHFVADIRGDIADEMDFFLYIYSNNAQSRSKHAKLGTANCGSVTKGRGSSDHIRN